MRPSRILIIDEARDDAALAAKILSSDGAASEVCTVTSAVQFAEELATGRFDVALIEAKVSWADGVELISAIKRVTPPRAVVLFTADVNAAFLSSALAHGLDGLALKNARGLLDLSETVRSALARQAEPAGLGNGPLPQLLERSQLALFQCTPEGRLVGANAPFTALLGFSIENAGGIDVLGAMLSPPARRFELVGRLHLDAFQDWTDVQLTRQDGRSIRGMLKAMWSTNARGVALITGLVTEASSAVGERPILDGTGERSLSLVHQALGTTHDLKEPLRTLVHSSEHLRSRYRGQLDDDAEEHLRFLHAAAVRMQAQVARLFEEPALRPTDAAPHANANVVLDRALENLRASVVATQARITRDPLPDLPLREDELLQLFQNLVSNALKFRGAEPPRVHISALQRAGEWLFSVEDNGIGIATEDLPRLFTLYARGSRAGQTPGSGIGLALCSSIVERHGGRIWASSNAGQGTTFYFTVPAAASGATFVSSAPKRSAND